MERVALFSMEKEIPSLCSQSLCERQWGVRPYARIGNSLRREAIGSLKKLKLWNELEYSYSVKVVPYSPPCEEKMVDCAKYAFEEVLGEREGFTSSSEFVFRMISNPISYLGLRGYAIEYEPQKLDLVAYVSQGSTGKPLTGHFGILESGQRVSSKWGKSHLFSHDIADVPYEFGEEVLLFRKVPRK